ncbi:unnamed protein product [Closterium sp. Naga37s-1]|nr:unnamed protein product [Closterium sp. Naga37s-1]
MPCWSWWVCGQQLCELIQPFEQRQQAVTHFIQGEKAGVGVEAVAIDDPFGPAITDPHMDAIAVSVETEKGAHAVNERRAANGLKPLDVIVAGGAWGRRVVRGEGGWCVGKAGGAWGRRVVHGEGGWCVGKAGGAWGRRVVRGEGGWCVGKAGGAWGRRVVRGEGGWCVGKAGGAWGRRVWDQTRVGACQPGSREEQRPQ